MTTTQTAQTPAPASRLPLYKRRWAQVTAGIVGLALIGGAAVGGATLAAPRTTVIRPAAHAIPAANGARPAPAAPASADPDRYAADILNAGITAPAAWIDKTGQQLVAYWDKGYTAAWTDANVLTPGGIYQYHLATFDQITARDFRVTPPAQGIQPAPAVPAAPAQPAAPLPQLTNPTAVVLQYYQDISDHDYQAAWAIGGDNLNGGSGYDSWVAGYDTTAYVNVTAYGTYSDGTVWTTLTAGQTDGSVRTYSGTYTVSNGVIVSASISQTS
jgi:hypothetical protein